MKKVLILGSLGMAGHVLYQRLSSHGYTIRGIARAQGSFADFILDVANDIELYNAIIEFKPDIVVNAIGVLVNESKKDTVNAIRINSLLPHLLSRWGRELGYKLVHISTDCVFSGKDGGYVESSFRDADDEYGRTKTLGEIINDYDLTIRTSIVGPELKRGGTGLFHWFMMQSIKIQGYTKSIWSGVSTLELANAVHWALEKNVSGLYHLTNGTPINKYDLLNLFKKYTEKEIQIEAVEGKNIDKSLVDTRKEMDYRIPDYDEMIRNMVAHVRKNPSMYQHYS